MSKERYDHGKELEEQIKVALLAGMMEGDPAGLQAQHAADLHRQWLCEFWAEGTYSKDTHRGIAEIYVADERFRAYYDEVAPSAAAFLRDAILIYCG